MKKSNLIAIGIAVALFIVPFFWLKPGFVDIGGDSGRLYFIDPLSLAQNLFQRRNYDGATTYAILPYYLLNYLLLQVTGSSTLTIGVDRGILLSIAFLSIYLIVKQLLTVNEKMNVRIMLSSLASGIIYITFITKLGWLAQLDTHNQIFLNTLIFYLLLRFCVTSNPLYGLGIIIISFIYSVNFSFTGMPQIASFYPLAGLFLLIILRTIYKIAIPWKKLCILFILLIGVHAFHLVPIGASIFDKGSPTHTNIFNTESILASGVKYFEANHKDLGKISLEIFQPSEWSKKTIFILIIPIIILLGFLKKPSRLLAVLSIFFAITLYLVSANITHIGIYIYKHLFYLPGFMMFRSFQEKWYYVYSFFYALLFGCSFYLFIKSSKRFVVIGITIFIICLSLYRIYPFLRGDAIKTPLYQSNNVTSVLKIDPDLIASLSFIKTLPQDGRVAIFPLTFPYFQLFYGKEGGAYMGVPTVLPITGRIDYAGFWTFGPYKQPITDALINRDIDSLIQYFSLLNIRYIFYNSDDRIYSNFPSFPYEYPKEGIPSIKDKTSYDALLTSLPIHKIYEKGFYSLYEIDKDPIRPLIYIEGNEAGSLTYKKISPVVYDISIQINERKTPFVIVFSDPYQKSWTLDFKNNNGVVKDHVMINNYANAWTIDPTKTNNSVIHGRIYLMFQNYFYIGGIISVLTFIAVTVLIILYLFKLRYAKT